MTGLRSQEELFGALEQGVLTLLPGAYAARALRSAFDGHQRALGRSAWESARALSWSEWTGSLWAPLITAGTETRLLLNAAQEESLWAEVIAEVSPELAGEAVESMLGLARSAWALAAAWMVRHRLRGEAGTHDSHTFARWASEFERRCTQRGCLSAALLEEALVRHIGAAQLSLPRRLCLVNFPELSPAQARLLAALRQRSVEIEMVTTAAATTENQDQLAKTPNLLALAANEHEELRVAAHWVRSQIRSSQTATGPLRVGVLLPEKDLDRAELEAALREVLAPELQDIGTDLAVAPWEFAAGETLARLPLLASALDVVRLCTRSLPLNAVSGLLLSPYVGKLQEREANVHFDAYVLRNRTRLRPEMHLRGLALLAAGTARRSRSSQTAPASWLSGLQEFSSKTLGGKLRRTFSEWMEVLRHLLKLAGWPGERELTAREIAAVAAWEGALDEVATLDFAGTRVPFSEAARSVEQRIRNGSFDPPSKDAIVTVIDVRQAVGSTWDALVCLRGTEQHWPPRVRPHPLLGMGLQRELRMPGTRAEERSEPVRALLAASRKALATCAKENADGPLRPAPLFDQLGFRHIAAGEIVTARAFVPDTEEELITDDKELPALPTTEVRGGARVLQLQAMCGFRAFAEIRLRAEEMGEPEPGFDKLENGTWMHRVLEIFWKQVQSHASLVAMSWNDREHLLQSCISEALSSLPAAESAWEETYLHLQKDRLKRVLLLWLKSETDREPFQVRDFEQATTIPVGPLTLKVRADRVDEIADGVVLVDYKTGSVVDTKGWLGDRPEQPQLPLYTLRHAPEEVKAVTFAQVRPGKMDWVGYQANEQNIHTGRRVLHVELTEQMAQWRSTLIQLATDFHAGHTAVSPKDFAHNCKRCEQRLLCRLDPASLHNSQLGDEEEFVEEEIDG